MRNIQKNLVPKWDSSSKISELIDELPNLCNNFEYQIGQGLLPDLGEYFKLSKTNVLVNGEPKNGFKLGERLK